MGVLPCANAERASPVDGTALVSRALEALLHAKLSLDHAHDTMWANGLQFPRMNETHLRNVTILLMGDSVSRFTVEAAEKSHNLPGFECVTAKNDARLDFRDNEDDSVALIGRYQRLNRSNNDYRGFETHAKRCVDDDDLEILWISQDWGFYPVGRVFWTAAGPRGLDGIVDGLEGIGADGPRDFVRRLHHLWANGHPILNTMKGRDILVIWSTNMWQVATMNHRTFFTPRNSPFVPAMITPMYEAGLVRNMTLHVRAFDAFMRQRGNNPIHVVRLTDEVYTFTKTTTEYRNQHPHLLAINRAWRIAARQMSVPLFDATKLFQKIPVKSAMRDEVHPQPWVLRHFFSLYKVIASLGFSDAAQFHRIARLGHRDDVIAALKQDGQLVRRDQIAPWLRQFESITGCCYTTAKRKWWWDDLS